MAGMDKEPSTIAIHVRVTPTILAQLRIAAEGLDRSVAYIMAQAAREWLAARSAAKGETS